VTGHDSEFSVTHLDHHGQAISMPARDLDIVSLVTQRPEAISIRNILSGTVAEIVRDPDTAFAETLIDIGGGRLRARITRQSVSDLDLAPGKRVNALVKSIAFDRCRRSVGNPNGG
jgi:molybdate transport system ATP-binding protein